MRATFTESTAMAPRHILIAMLATLLWGCNFIASKYALQHFTPFFFSSMRFFLVGLALLPFVRRPQGAEWKAIGLLSFVLATGHLAFSIMGLANGLDIATTVITIQLGTPFACALGAVLLNDKLGPWRTGGLVIAFLGILLVVGTPSVAQNYTGFLLVLFSALMFGFANIVMKRGPVMPMLTVIGWMSLMSVPQIALISLLFEADQWQQVATFPENGLIALAYSAFGSTIVGYGSWYWLMGRYEVTQVTPFALLVPIFGISIGQLFFHETLSPLTIIGGIITLIGVGIIVIRRPRTAEMGT